MKTHIAKKKWKQETFPSPTFVKIRWQNIHNEKNKEKLFKYDFKKETNKKKNLKHYS